MVLVTGASQRIGRAIALELARAGWAVAVHFRRSGAAAGETVAQLRAAGARAASFGADLADEAACEALVPAVVHALGRLDAVVNNASLFEPDDATSTGFAAMERHWRANTAAPVLLARALHRVVCESGQGASPSPGGAAVINLLDQKLWNPNPDYFSYTLSKAALESATTMLALALAPAVRVCGVAPGITLLSGAMTQAEFATAHSMTPLARSSTADDVARAVRYLLESPAITGTTLLVDGGQHLAAQRRDVMYLAREASPSNRP